MRIIINLFTAVGCLLLAACATPYQAMGSTGGYYENRISENSYIVGFRGNGFSSKADVTDMTLFRAAEIGHQLEFTHFTISGVGDTSTSQLVRGQSTTTTSGYVSGNSYYGTSTTTPTLYPVYKPGSEMLVTYSDGTPEGRHLNVYNVEDIYASKAGKYLYGMSY